MRRRRRGNDRRSRRNRDPRVPVLRTRKNSPSLHSSIQRLAVAATVAETAVASNVSPRGRTRPCTTRAAHFSRTRRPPRACTVRAAQGESFSFPQTGLGFALCNPVLAAPVRANRKPRPVCRLRLEQVVDVRLADVYDAAPDGGPLLRRSQTPAHAFLFFGGLRQLVGRLARIGVQRQHPERAATFSERQRRPRARRRRRGRRSGRRVWLNVVSWTTRAVCSVPSTLPGEARRPRHPFVRQKPIRRLPFGALRARKPALPDFPPVPRVRSRPSGRAAILRPVGYLRRRGFAARRPAQGLPRA